MNARNQAGPKEINVISPHLDDAVFSAWNQIKEPGARVLTVFTGIPDDPTPSKWDLSTGFNSSHEVMEARIQENERALAKSGAAAVNLGFLEREYRDVPPSVTEVADKIESMSASDEALFVAAAGIGRYGRRHSDHVITRQVGLELLERGRRVQFFADLPYMLPVVRINRWPERLQAAKIGQELGLAVEIESVELAASDQQNKRAAALAYKTQFNRTNRAAFGALGRKSAYKWEALIRPK